MEEMKISVVMSCYNSERFLRQSIDSILMQSYREFEFIIWNDGSTDSTEEIIKSYHDERIRYFYAPNQGLGSALAAACKEARGRYIARMDDDDIAMPNRLDKELAFLELHPDYILVSCLCEFITEEGKCDRAILYSPAQTEHSRGGVIYFIRELCFVRMLILNAGRLFRHPYRSGYCIVGTYG